MNTIAYISVVNATFIFLAVYALIILSICGIFKWLDKRERNRRQRH